MSFLYVNEAQTKLYIDLGRIVAEKKDGLKTMLPLEMLEGVVLIGNANMTSGCSKELLKRGIPVTYLSGNGSFYGRLESTRHMNIEQQRSQFRRGDDNDFCLQFAQKVISSKINNQLVVLRRYNRYINNSRVETIIDDIEKLRLAIGRINKYEQVLGYEGIASKKYFEGCSALIKGEFAFEGRTKMPPKDPFNSLISFGYTLLMYEVYTAVVNHGLHPYAGLLHKDRRGHPALVSDLMEEWRPVIVDSLALNLLNNAILKSSDFTKEIESEAVMIQKDAIKIYLLEFEKKVRTEAKYLQYFQGALPFRRAIQHQAAAIAKAIEENDISLYQPVRLR